jgi:hypothetical protein
MSAAHILQEPPLNGGEKRFVDVWSYGAFGDGITDDTMAIRLAAEVARMLGNVPLLLMGNHLVSDALDLSDLRLVDARPANAPGELLIRRSSLLPPDSRP